MWKRDEAVRPPTAERPSSKSHGGGTPPASIGPSLVIKGELGASEDLAVNGLIEGKVDLPNHVLTIGPNAKVTARVFAKAVVIHGHVMGNVTASERVEIRGKG